jgi:hypothetical protein
MFTINLTRNVRRQCGLETELLHDFCFDHHFDVLRSPGIRRVARHFREKLRAEGKLHGCLGPECLSTSEDHDRLCTEVSDAYTNE